METLPLHRTFQELSESLRRLPPAPADEGTVALVVARPATGQRITPERCRLSPSSGVDGDRWSARPNPNPLNQVTVMRADAAEVFADGQPLSLFGDNLLIHLDLHENNLPAGTVVRVGTALCEVTPLPHTGCGKFAARFGADARSVTDAAEFRAWRLRGIHLRVLDAGEVGVGDVVRVVSRPER